MITAEPETGTVPDEQQALAPRWSFRHLRSRSLRVRLTGVFALAMLVVLVSLGVFVYLRLGGELLGAVDRSLGARSDALTATLTADPHAPLGGGRRFADPDESFAQVLDPDGQIIDGTPAVPGGAPLLTPAQARRITRPAYLTYWHSRDDDPDRLLAIPALAGGRPVIAVTGETLGDRSDALHHLLMLYAVAGPGGLLLASAAGWFLAGAALRPVEDLRRCAAQLSQDSPEGRLPVPATDELARLATTFNDLLGRMHAAATRERRFADDASHELRTPLAVLKAELGLAVSRPRSAGELRTTLDAASTQTDRLIDLAEDLLVLARTRPGQQPDRLVAVRLDTLLAEGAAPLREPLRTAGRTLELRAGGDLVTLDPAQVSRAIRNLVENALRYGEGAVVVTGQVAAGMLRIEVRDQGPGFPPKLLATAFEPFTHGAGPAGDQAGTGLGLAIVRSIAVFHGGTVTAANLDAGADVRLELPQAHDGSE